VRGTGGDEGYSNEKIFFQSFFMLITVQLFFLASAKSAVSYPSHDAVCAAPGVAKLKSKRC
jgi:hypothetical protein